LTPRLTRPELAEPITAWKAVNGWARLARVMQRRPDLIPYWFVIRGVRPALVGEGIVESVFTADVPGDGEFYGFAGSMAFWDDDILGTQGFKGDFADSPEKGRVTVELRVEQGGKPYSNRPVHLGSIFGTGARPFFYPVPFIWQPNTRIVVRYRAAFSVDYDGENHNVMIVFHGFKRLMTSPPLPVDILLEPRLLDTFRDFRGRGQLGKVEPYFYGFNFEEADVLARPADPRTINVAGGDFAGVYQMAAVFAPQTPTACYKSKPTTLVRFVRGMGKTRIDYGPHPLVNLCGVGKRPYRYVKPLVLRKGESLTTIVTHPDRSDGVQGSWETYITLAGVKIHPPAER
jgi:hypothetical protein